jgi:WD40 repeat protein
LLTSPIILSFRALESEKEATFHEGLHIRAVTCVAICKQGEYIATGSEDMTVRVWKVVKSKNNGRRLAEIVVFAGHEDSITCLEISTEFSIVVSGSRDRQVCVWDYRSQVMIRTLSSHTSPILSVSVNAISGNIVTLTKEQLRVYHLNGELISYQNFFEPFQDMNISLGKVVLSPPCGEWQNGVVAITGHKDGSLYIWKLDNRVSRPLVRKDTSDPALHPMGNTHFRKLSVVCQPPKTHQAEITCLRLCPAGGPVNRTRDLIRKTYEDSRNLDLLVGDAEGQVSRWTAARLDQLSPQDLNSLLSR